MTAFSDETGRGWLPLKYEDGPDFCTVTFATGAAFALTVHPERMKLMEAALSHIGGLGADEIARALMHELLAQGVTFVASIDLDKMATAVLALLSRDKLQS